jgi:hypothetical protein
MDSNTLAIVAVLAFAASEIIGLNPKWKSNSVVQVLLLLVRNALRPSLPEDSRYRDRR